MTAAPRAAGPRIALALAALALTCVALPCGVASANEYHVFSCEDPYTGQGAPAADWSYDQGTNGYGDGAGSSCSGGGGSISAWMDGGVTHGFGEGGYANFNVPGAMTISAFTIWRYEAVGPYEPFAAPATNIAYNPGNVSVEGLCAQSLSCSSRGNPQDRLAAGNEVGAGGLVGVTQISASAVCGGGPGTSYVCPTSDAENGNSAEVDIYAADITLSDPTVPAVTNVSGPLVSGAALSGNTSIAFSASDPDGPGIYSGTITVDGQVRVSQIIDTNGGECQSLGGAGDGLRAFNEPQPCKPQVSGTLTLNTSTLSPGAHQVLVTVDDASGNSATVWDGTITTTLPPHIPNGAPACEQAQLSLAVNGRNSSAVIRFGGRAMVTGLLRCGTAPIASATVGVSGGGIRTELVTAPDGTFSYSVPNGPSRRLTFSYRAYSDDPSPSADARAVVSVIPRIRLRISPHRTHNGGTIGWRGELLDGPFPTDGVTLLIEVREGRRWQPFDQVVAVKGRFAYRYTFLRTTSPTSYRFRVALPASGSSGYDYQPGGSNAITVHVR
jgi:hypothetical protein